MKLFVILKEVRMSEIMDLVEIMVKFKVKFEVFTNGVLCWKVYYSFLTGLQWHGWGREQSKYAMSATNQM